jgi:cytochrome P450
MGNVAAFGRLAQAANKQTAATGADDFDPTLLQSNGIAARIVEWVVRHPFALMAFARLFWPIPTFKGWAIVTRYDDVAEALQNDKAIAVPFGDQIKTLNGGPNFVLGMADGPEYQTLHKATVAVFPREDNAAIIGPMAYHEASNLLELAEGRIDGVRGLLTLVPTRICEKYYGLTIPDEANFARWTIAMSSYMFGNPNNDPNLEKAAIAAGALVGPIMDDAITKAKMAPTADTIAARLVRQQAENAAAMPDETIRAILIGMVTGFVPTNTMASGHMLDLLLDRPDWMAQAKQAALRDDDGLLQRCLFEAMRFWPLNPGPFRVAAEDVTLAAGTRRAKTIKKGTKMLVSTQSAMFDPRRVEHPNRFDPDRKPVDYMLMGFGLHWCIGAPLAYAQITQTFKPLLKRHNLRRAPGKAGKMTRFGPFPESLMVLYDH